MKNKLLPIALLALAVSAGVDAAEAKASPLRDKVAAKHKVLEQGAWNGRNRIAFEFGGRKAWIVEPSNAPRNGMPWTWTFHWPDLDVERTGVVAMLDDGYHHAYIDLFDTRMDDAGVAAAATFQEYLVKELGFAPKANLIGLGWGGFMAARYAAQKPENVSRLYLDNALLTFFRYTPPKELGLGPWAANVHKDGTWRTDERMPVNLAPKIAAAGIRVLLVYGGADRKILPGENSRAFERAFKAAKGNCEVRERKEYGHRPHGFDAGEITVIKKFFESP